MKTLGKAIANKVALIIILFILILSGWYVLKTWNPFNNGTNKAQYNYVLKEFSRKNELVVSEALVETQAVQQFSNNELEKWPDWTKPITSIFVGRNISINIPVKTEFKLDLSTVTSDSIKIENSILTFKKPLLIKADSQQSNNIKIVKSNNGLADKVVDVWTSGSKAQEFLNEKSLDAINSTTDYVINKESIKEKVIKHSAEDLENLINLNSKEPIKVKIEMNNVIFENEDKE